MREILVTIGLILAIAALGTVSLVHWRHLFAIGGVLTIAGFAIGVPSGLLYHIQLYRCVRELVRLPRYWFWKPIGFNRHLRPGDRMRVMSWCYIGAAGFFIIVIGQLLLIVSMAIAYARV